MIRRRGSSGVLSRDAERAHCGDRQSAGRPHRGLGTPSMAGAAAGSRSMDPPGRRTDGSPTATLALAWPSRRSDACRHHPRAADSQAIGHLCAGLEHGWGRSGSFAGGPAGGRAVSTASGSRLRTCTPRWRTRLPRAPLGVRCSSRLALRPTIPARERFYADTRFARRGNAPLRQTGSTVGPVACLSGAGHAGVVRLAPG